MKDQPLEQRFQHLETVIASDRFRLKQGLGNEVPFFICPFPVREAMAMADLQRRLESSLDRRGVRVLSLNFYDLCIELLQEREIWDQVLAMEPDLSKAELKELFQGVLDPETYLVPKISNYCQRGEYDVLFLAGVGEVFPYIRSHTVLNNLQSYAKEKPTVLFFPGAYTQSLERGASLNLFGRLHDDRYYRAFNIYDYTV
ncbi:MAG: DUF1788 domain-containing protein [Spirulina sp. DLM2.Bin59]|nr:MAG: DUF1788 domain-containing protein [Spirulina sp. DLM2.Bin59]